MLGDAPRAKVESEWDDDEGGTSEASVPDGNLLRPAELFVPRLDDVVVPFGGGSDDGDEFGYGDGGSGRGLESTPPGESRSNVVVSLAAVSGALAVPGLSVFSLRSPRSPRLRCGRPSLSLRALRLRLTSAFLRDRATRSLWQDMHQIPCEVLAKMSSSILLWHDRHRKQSAWYDSSPGGTH